MTTQGANSAQSPENKFLFSACFVALIATAFGFIIRTLIINDLGAEFNLSETQKGEILGVGLWPFAISIVLFSLVIDKIGYGRVMAFAFVCHMLAGVITIFANGYNMLYVGTFIMTLGNGAVEAVINPVVATMFTKDKTRWLNALHAGWPGGLVVGGVIALALGPEADWQWKVGLVFVPTVAYGIMMFGRKFPVHERVAAGVSYQTMLREVGIIGALIIVALMTFEVGRVFNFASFGTLPIGNIPLLNVLMIAAVVAVFAFYVRSFGRPLFIFLLLVMIPLATTELGTDSWITPLMETEMNKLGMQAGWLLVYTSFIMMVLRFMAGPIVHALSPLGLLATCAAVAACGLTLLSVSAGALILVAATLYGFGKAFFWPTMLGVVAERFPKGGAMTINTIAGVGMLSVGIVGSVFLGFVQDTSIGRELDDYDKENSTQLHAKYIGEERNSVFGEYRPLDQDKVGTAGEEDKQVLADVSNHARKGALRTVAVLPVIMLVCYIGLIFYFRSIGGYKALDIDDKTA
ncbi:MAG: MFS transporter [Candidatus Hydrogenedentota bacterium]